MVILVALPIKLYAFATMNKQGWLTRRTDLTGGEAQDGASLGAAPGSPATVTPAPPASQAARRTAVDVSALLERGRTLATPVLRAAIDRGATDILVLLTRPPSYRSPEPTWKQRLLFRPMRWLGLSHIRRQSSSQPPNDAASAAQAFEGDVVGERLQPDGTRAPVRRFGLGMPLETTTGAVEAMSLSRMQPL